MAIKSERLQVPIDIGMRQEIERAAREQDVSLSQVMRQAIREWAARRAQKRVNTGERNDRNR